MSADHRSGGNSKAATITKTLAAVGAGALVVRLVRFGFEVFGPTRPFKLQDSDVSPESDHFASCLSLATDALLYRDTQIQVLRNGKEFYPAEFTAIESARQSINLEAFEFFEGEITTEIIHRLCERARSGVEVRLIVDRFGSWNTKKRYFEQLVNAGGRMIFYHPVDFRNLSRLDNRTHRKMLIIDGRIGFIGGAGFADHWFKETKGKPAWRDTVLRVEGGVAASLNATFSQNWAAATGEILFSKRQFPNAPDSGGKTAMVIMSTPGYGGTRARILFQALIESARCTIHITSPYFLPDRNARHALMRAARDRNVEVCVLTNGVNGDHPSVRRLSRVMSTKLIRAGVDYYEYQPGMIHAKLLTIDGLWTIAGSTNFDNRSFALNDEVNIAICDREVTSIIDRQFHDDLQPSECVSPRELEHQNLSSELLADAAWVLRREE